MGRLRQSGWNDRAQKGVEDSRLRCRSHQTASSATRRGGLATPQSGQAVAGRYDHIRRIYRKVFRAERAPHVETFNSESLSFNPQLLPRTCFWSQAALRYFDSRSSVFRSGKIRFRFGVGTLQSSPQPDVEDLLLCEELETIRPKGFSCRRRPRCGRDVPSPRNNVEVCSAFCQSRCERWS